MEVALNFIKESYKVHVRTIVAHGSLDPSHVLWYFYECFRARPPVMQDGAGRVKRMIGIPNSRGTPHA